MKVAFLEQIRPAEWFVEKSLKKVLAHR